jgi:hypothetical protein
LTDVGDCHLDRRRPGRDDGGITSRVADEQIRRTMMRRRSAAPAGPALSRRRLLARLGSLLALPAATAAAQAPPPGQMSGTKLKTERRPLTPEETARIKRAAQQIQPTDRNPRSTGVSATRPERPPTEEEVDRIWGPFDTPEARRSWFLEELGNWRRGNAPGMWVWKEPDVRKVRAWLRAGALARVGPNGPPPPPPPPRAYGLPAPRRVACKLAAGLPGTPFGPEDAVRLVLEWHNLSSELVTLSWSGFCLNHWLELRDADGCEPALTRHGVWYRERWSPCGPRDSNVPQRIEPHTVWREYGGGPRLDMLYALSPGKYEVRCTYHDPEWGARHSILRVVSNWATFRIAAP